VGSDALGGRRGLTPAFVVVDDEEETIAALEVALCRRFGADYRVLAECSASAGLAVLEEMRDRGEPVAVVLSDLWMPEMTGVEFLVRAHQLHPAAGRALLLQGYDHRDTEQVSRAMALGRIDTWVFKPWDPPDERLYPRISELVTEWVTATNQPGFRAVRVVAESHAPRTHELRDMLDRNDIPFELFSPDSAPGRELLEEAGLDGRHLPVAVYFDGRVQSDPSTVEIVTALGGRTRPDADHYDITVVGAGPAGLSAALCSASEGLRTLMLEPCNVGGQASSTSMIRNYLGFPRGITGRRLASMAYDQTTLFDASLVFDRAISLEARGDQRVLTLAGGAEVSSDVVVISVGVDYRRLPAPGVNELLGAGVFYGAAVSEAPAMRGQPVFIVGAGNSAGQAAVHLAKFAEHVTLVVRRPSLSSTMSDYLIKEIQATPTITVRLSTQVIGACGAGHLERLTLHDDAAEQIDTVAASALFIMIGASPHTEWLKDTILCDDLGFILSGADLMRDGRPPKGWAAQRPPYPMEASTPGVFAVGDVRHGSVKRVASAVGAGSIAIQFAHQYLSAH
jgi:thioredoxin reductase (NADPH)